MHYNVDPLCKTNVIAHMRYVDEKDGVIDKYAFMYVRKEGEEPQYIQWGRAEITQHDEPLIEFDAPIKLSALKWVVREMDIRKFKDIKSYSDDDETFEIEDDPFDD